VVEAIRSDIGKGTGDAVVAGDPAQPGALQDDFRRLARLLAADDTECVTLLDALQKRLTGSPVVGKARRLAARAGRYDFEGALGDLRALADQLEIDLEGGR